MQRNTFLMAGLLWAGLGVTFVANAANCSCVHSATPLDESGIKLKLAGKVVCAQFGSGASAERWQERHDGTDRGNIVELGNSPLGEVVGTWSVTTNGNGNGNSNNAKVVYNYGSTSYSYEVCEEGSNVHFCGVRAITNATVGSAKCW